MAIGGYGLDHRFEQLFGEHAEKLYRLALWLSKSHEQAEELVQEAALKAYRSFGSFRPDGNFGAWISKILTNTYIDRYRRQGRAPIAVDFQDHEPAAPDRAEAGHFSTEELDGFEDHVDELIKHSVDRLAAHLRPVFLLSSLAELSYQEIADALEIPIGTVMSRLYRARQQLKEELRSYAAEHGYGPPKQ